MRRIDDGLGIGLVVDGGDDAVFKANLFVQYLDHRSQTVGGARRGCQQMMFVRFVEIIIDAHDDIERAFLDRCSHDDFLDATIKVRL